MVRSSGKGVRLQQMVTPGVGGLSKRKVIAALGILACLSTPAILLMIFAPPTDRVIEFRLPPEFTGPIVVREDQNASHDLRFEPHHLKKPGLHESRAVLQVPSGGEIRLKTLEPFRGWHSERFVTSEGTVLESRTEDPDPHVRQVFDLGMEQVVTPSSTSPPTKRIIYYVGSKLELTRWQDGALKLQGPDQ